MEYSEQIDKITPAFYKFQCETQGAKKDGRNPHAGNKYATLESVLNSIKEPMKNNDLFLLQAMYEDAGNMPDGFIGVETTIFHISGQYFRTKIKMPCTKTFKNGGTILDCQTVGSAITYGKRYSLLAMCGLPSEDDDGNRSVNALREQSKNKSTNENNNENYANKIQIEKATYLIKQLGYSDSQIKPLLNRDGYSSFNEMHSKRIDSYIEQLTLKVKNKKNEQLNDKRDNESNAKNASELIGDQK